MKPLGLVARFEIRLLRRGERLHHLVVQRGAREIGKGRHVDRLAGFVPHQRGARQRRQALKHGADPFGQRVGAAFIDSRALVPRRAQRDFPRRLGRETAHSRLKRLRKRAGQYAQRIGERAPIQRGIVHFALLGRSLIHQSRQNLAHAADFVGHAAHAVDDLAALLHEDQIGILAHELADQRAHGVVAHLVERFEIDLGDAVAGVLADLQHARAQNVLAHEHTEGRRLERIVFLLARQVHPRAVRRGRDQQHMIFALVANGQQYFVALGLRDFVHAAARQPVIELARHKSQHNAVHRHSGIPPLSI